MGVMWQTHELSPAQEHFASHIISKKLHTAIDKLPRPMGSTSFVLFLLPGELHELGLLLSNYLLKKNGVKVLYLGPNLSTSSIQEAVNQMNVKNLFTIIHSKNNLEKNFLSLQEITLSTQANNLFFSGPKSILESYEHIPKAIPIDGIEAFHKMIKSLR
jgi:methanogenic corrinoid protein MtbC1